MNFLTKLETRFQELLFLFGLIGFPLMLFGVTAPIWMNETQSLQNSLGSWGYGFFNNAWELFGYASFLIPIFFVELLIATILRFHELKQLVRQYPFVLWRTGLYLFCLTAFATLLGVTESSRVIASSDGAAIASAAAETLKINFSGYIGNSFGFWLHSKLGAYGAFGTMAFFIIGAGIFSGALDLVALAMGVSNLCKKIMAHFFTKFEEELKSTTAALSHGSILAPGLGSSPSNSFQNFYSQFDYRDLRSNTGVNLIGPSHENTTKPSRAKRKSPVSKTSVESTEKVEIEATAEISTEKKELELKPYTKRTKLPEKTCLDSQSKFKIPSEQELQEKSLVIEDRLLSFGVKGSITDVHPGIRLTMFEFMPESGIKLSKISALSSDLALLLGASSIRILAPIPGKSTVGIEVPNETTTALNFSTCLSAIQKAHKTMNLPVLIGEDVTRKVHVQDLSAMPHLLISGTTGSGKSVFVNTLINSLIFTKSPKDLRMIMIDPKMIELTPYNSLPHLAKPVISDVTEAKETLQWAEREMDRRYNAFAEIGARNIESFNEKIKQISKARVEESLGRKIDWNWSTMPFLVIIIDELADLMITQGKEVEIPITRIAQKARACGIHMVLCTQRPSADIVTGLIKTNFPSRISFKVSSNIDSRTIIDQSGAEKLLGNGDMLFLPNGKSIERLQGAFISETEVNSVVSNLTNS